MTVPSVVEPGPRVHSARLTRDDISDRVMSWFHHGGPRRWFSRSGGRYVRVETIREMESADSAGANVSHGVFPKDHVKLICTLRVEHVDLRPRTSDMPPFVGEHSAHSRGLVVTGVRPTNQIAFEYSDVAKHLEGHSRRTPC